MDNPPPGYVMAPDFKKVAKVSSGGAPEMIETELRENFDVIDPDETELTDEQRIRYEQLKAWRLDQLDQPSELTEEEIEEYQNRTIQEDMDTQVMNLRRRNLTQAMPMWNELSQQEKDEIDRDIDEAWELEKVNLALDQQNMSDEFRNFRRAQRLIPITDEQMNRARSDGRRIGLTRAQEEMDGLVQSRENRKQSIKSLNKDQLKSGAIALEENSTLLTNSRGLKILMEDHQGQVQDLNDLVLQMKEDGLLPQSLSVTQNARDYSDRKQLKGKLTGLGRVKREIGAKLNEDSRDKLDDNKEKRRGIRARRRQGREEYDQLKVDRAQQEQERLEQEERDKRKSIDLDM